MLTSFRNAFYVGLTVALALGLWLVWLWGSEHQVKLHSDNLLRAVEKKKWERVGSFLADDYQDQWGNDRARLLSRSREVSAMCFGVSLPPSHPPSL